MSVGLIYNDSHGGREVETSDLSPDRDAVDPFRKGLDKGRGKTCGLPAKKEMTARAVGCPGVGPFTTGRKKEHVLWRRGQKGIKALVLPYGHVRPVVETGPFQVPVIKRKPERMDEVKDGVGGPAEPDHIPSVGGDFRLDENDIQGKGRGIQDEKPPVSRRAALISSKKGRDPTGTSLRAPLLSGRRSSRHPSGCCRRRSTWQVRFHRRDPNGSFRRG